MSDPAGAGAPWLRSGFPATIAWTLIGCAPFALSGALRAVSGWNLGSCLAVAVALTLAIVVALRRGLAAQPRDWRATTWALVTMSALAATAVIALYNRHFWGAVVLASSGIPDAGNHVVQKDLFVAQSPDQYVGFVSLYSFVEWLQRIFRLDDFWAFLVATYFAIGFYACLGVACSACALHRFRDAGRAWVVGWVAAALWSFALLLVTLPFLHYHHAQGFFPPIFGLLPLATLWMADAVIRPAWLRMLAAGVMLVLYRYTYGLNVPDLAVALAFIVAVDGVRARPAALRAAAAVFAIALLLAAWRSALLLRATYEREGPFDPYDRHLVLVAQWSCLAVMALALALPALRETLARSGVVRWLRLPIGFALVNAAFMTVVPQPARGHDYYYLKSNFHPLLLMLAATVVLVAVLAAGSVGTRARAAGGAVRPFIAPLAIVAALGASVATLHRGLAAYWPSFRERAMGAPPFRSLKPLADLRAWVRIERVLRERHASFGGYLTSYYPTFNFMNAAFGYWNGGIKFYWGAQQPKETPGSCVFWEGGPAASRLEPVFPLEPLTNRLASDARHQCVSYPAAWDPRTVRTLCWLCR